jgi:hypothetical protein
VELTISGGATDRLHVHRLVCVVAERVPELSQRDAQAAVEIDEGVFSPDAPLDNME